MCLKQRLSIRGRITIPTLYFSFSFYLISPYFSQISDQRVKGPLQNGYYVPGKISTNTLLMAGANSVFYVRKNKTKKQKNKNPRSQKLLTSISPCLLDWGIRLKKNHWSLQKDPIKLYLTGSLIVWLLYLCVGWRIISWRSTRFLITFKEIGLILILLYV